MNPEWSKKCAIVLLNEIKPRADKLNMSLRKFLDPKLCSLVIAMEFNGLITRRELRSLLDERVKYIKENDMKENHF